METRASGSRPAGVADRLWRAYAPFQRGRNTSGDLTSMLAILLLAGFVESEGGPDDEFVRRWARAAAEARIGISPLMDLRAAMMSASRHPRFPVSEIRNLAVDVLDADQVPDDVPWATAFLTALTQPARVPAAELPDVCELLLERHVQDSTVSTGEYHTPREVVRLLVESVDPRAGDRILDPACGTGGLLAAAARHAAGAGRIDGTSLEAHATDSGNPRLATLNLAIHGVDQPVVSASDPVLLSRRAGRGLADVVLSNPPFNQRVEHTDRIDWPFGPPPASNANFAWLQLAWDRLSEGGRAAVIMPWAAAWSQGRDAEIRRRMVSRGALLAVVALPENLFTHTSVPVHVWLLARDKSRHLPPGDDRALLFIDASRLGRRARRRPRVLTADDVERITARLRQWLRSPRAAADEPGFSASVPHEEVLDNGGNLDPRMYIHAEGERATTARDLDLMLDELDRQGEAASESHGGVRRALRAVEQLSSGGAEPRSVSLRSIVDGRCGDDLEESTPGQLFAGPSGSLIRAADHVDAGIPVVMPKDLTGNGFSMAGLKYIAERQAEGLNRFRLHSGDVVLARRGELGRCAVVRAEQHGWICGTGCFVLRPPAQLDPDYFAAYLRRPEVRAWLEARSTGSMALKTISLSVLGQLRVVLPDLGRQRVIADAMSRLDQHEQLVREQLALTGKIRAHALAGIVPTP